MTSSHSWQQILRYVFDIKIQNEKETESKEPQKPERK